MRHVYIDLGCYDGDTVEEFRNWSKVAFDTNWEWDIYAFDPNPNFADDWERKVDSRTQFMQTAAWIKDGIGKFAIEKGNKPLGSTLMPGKEKVWNSSPKTEVVTFDFSKFLTRFRDDFVVVKMDIEGAEFPILEKMIKESTDKICDWLLIEFHANKVVEYTTTDKSNLLTRLRDRNPNVREWH